MKHAQSRWRYASYPTAQEIANRQENRALVIALLVLMIALAAAWLLRDRPEPVEHPTAPDFLFELHRTKRLNAFVDRGMR